MRIGELATRSGMAASTIRYYEQEGLLPRASRNANGYRVYQESALEQLNLIDVGQKLGFSLDAIRTVLGLQGAALQDGLLQGLDTRLGEIDGLMATLATQRQALLDARERLQQAWAQGECLNQAALAKGGPACDTELAPLTGSRASK
ncbi:MerR family transcriptional regulator [Pseudoduganella lutea]|uniref:MerR family transcriptional regulator n=2 Tax=Pseudoduganella lutea TaxID=321985 RepID=A0A4P6L7V1_9BURK|nr:MerR family transcriptional regulator [Pseudoduganella lutea]